MGKQATLALAPEFGGQVFGPFAAGTIRLGSDGSQCALALQASLGIRPVHAQLTVQPDGRALLAPVEVAGQVFVHRPGRPPERLGSAVNLSPGEAFSLASPDGVRFTLGLMDTPAAQMPSAARPRGADRLSANSLAAEARRQADASLQTMGAVAGARQLGYQAQSGALFQPRNVVAAIVAIGGAAVMGCGGLGTVIYAWLRHHG